MPTQYATASAFNVSAAESAVLVPEKEYYESPLVGEAPMGETTKYVLYGVMAVGVALVAWNIFAK